MLIPTQIIGTSAMICYNKFLGDLRHQLPNTKFIGKKTVTLVAVMKVMRGAVVYSIFKVIMAKIILFLMREHKYK